MTHVCVNRDKFAKTTTSPEESVTPFFSNPSESQLLFSSPSLSPTILHRVPRLDFSQSPEASHCHLLPQSSPPLVSHIVTNQWGRNEATRVLSYNRLQFLPCLCHKSVKRAVLLIRWCPGLSPSRENKSEKERERDRKLHEVINLENKEQLRHSNQNNINDKQLSQDQYQSKQGFRDR
ncbi:hypothetical protein YC2023_061837 [Brassica napus]